MFRRVFLVFLVACIAAPAAAQTAQGWKVRVDRSQDVRDPDNTPDLKFMPMGKGFHVTGGPAGTFWNPANTTSGDYTLRATFNLLQPSNHTNYYGLVFGGSELDAAGQSYSYFVIAQDGTYQVRQRTGEKVATLNRGANAAIRRPEGKGQAANTLEVRVAGDTISYVVNGTVVHTAPKSSTKTDGIAGVRVNHLLDVHIESFDVQKR